MIQASLLRPRPEQRGLDHDRERTPGLRRGAGRVGAIRRSSSMRPGHLLSAVMRCPPWLRPEEGDRERLLHRWAPRWPGPGGLLRGQGCTGPADPKDRAPDPRRTGPVASVRSSPAGGLVLPALRGRAATSNSSARSRVARHSARQTCTSQASWAQLGLLAAQHARGHRHALRSSGPVPGPRSCSAR